MRQLLELHEASEACEDRQRQDGDLGAGEDPEHFVSKFRSVLVIQKTEFVAIQKVFLLYC